jgi:hypothetical protein
MASIYLFMSEDEPIAVLSFAPHNSFVQNEAWEQLKKIERKNRGKKAKVVFIRKLPFYVWDTFKCELKRPTG